MSPRRKQETKTHLSKLVNRAATGEEIIIAKAGKEVAKLVPITDALEPRQPGIDAGKIWMSDDFNDPLPEDLLREFEG